VVRQSVAARHAAPLQQETRIVSDRTDDARDGLFNVFATRLSVSSVFSFHVLVRFCFPFA
jgi:hypothetical protein